MSYRNVKVKAKNSDETLTLPFTNDRAAERFAFIAREMGFETQVGFHKYTTFSNTDAAVANLKTWSR